MCAYVNVGFNPSVKRIRCSTRQNLFFMFHFGFVFSSACETFACRNTAQKEKRDKVSLAHLTDAREIIMEMHLLPPGGNLPSYRMPQNLKSKKNFEMYFP
jgi:hypothetical protein